ncbi:zinc-dependent metalloprotease [Fulvivirgaceae bacterium BMA12]|uniref:Zinc-dependent metalloprotease n=1 Tax=Agaribacillus aureus TaxID=3051825 RepID=A0ABT8L8Q8_9BACT|nr:zinc-dependent metalloprotease [Fulvivirgaceae bacterium BMA12]
MKKNLLNPNFGWLLLLFLFFIAANPASAQKKKNKKGKKAQVEAPAKPKPPKKDKKTIKGLTKASKKIEGLFTLYQDTTNGSIQMLINKEQLDREYIYFSQIADGVVDVFSFRGAYRGSKIFKIEKYYDKIEFVAQNNSSYFDADNAIAKAAHANISEGVMASEKILAYDTTSGNYLIAANNLFLKETFMQVKPPRFPNQSPSAFSLGTLSKDKTKVRGIRNYPANTDLKIEYVYSKPSVLNSGSRGVTDGRNVSIKVYHSLIQVPENDYQPRIDDPRAGFFTTQVTDMTSMSPTPYRDLVHRWHLKKKDPDATISEPVEPITWWIENTTPHEIRPIIRQAGLRWNEAFEKAGFKNAVVIKEQPDDATWDAGDIRYNVLRWTASPNPVFGGYGPSFVNPRTGQILGADIMLEYGSLKGNLLNEKIFDEALLETYLQNGENEKAFMEHDPAYCTAGQMAKLNNMFGLTALSVLGGSELDKSKMIKEFLHFLILHEMGHTLGLNHNMKASQFHGLKDINNQEVTEKVGLIGSVMDYPAVNFASDRENQGLYWTTRPGPYDHWVIEFGYKPVKSPDELQPILNRSTRPELVFGNDADDMRSPGKAIDPRVNVNDMTHDAVEYAVERMKLAKKVSKELLKKYQKPNQSYHELRNAYLVVTSQQAGAANIISRYIGGVYVDRAFVGQQGGTKPFTPVELEKQKKAMKALNDFVFSPEAFTVPSALYSHLQMQRRGYNFISRPEDPKIHARILNIQRTVLRHLLHYNTLQRITDSEMYGNAYSLSSFMSDLNQGIFKSDIYGNVGSIRRNLQVEYTQVLINMLTGSQKTRFNHLAKSMALYNLKRIRKMAGSATGNTATRAHKEHLKTLIDNALDEV